MNNRSTVEIVQASLKRRRQREQFFLWYGRLAITTAFVFLVIFFIGILSQGYTAFRQTHIKLDVYLDPEELLPATPNHLKQADYESLVKQAIYHLFPEVKGRRDKIRLKRLLSIGAADQVREYVFKNPDAIGKTVSLWLLANSNVDMFFKGVFSRENPGSLSKKQIEWIEQLQNQGRIALQFNRYFWTNGDSREPELAGILGALMGSFYMMMVTFLLSFPLGIAAAIYLEEFAPQKNFWVDMIEININNLAAVPSIVFGLLGLSIFLQFLGIPRSTPLAGGLVLTLMTLPTVIIASRAALKAVPQSIRDAALALGASKMQTVFHHVLPLALPGMLTGAIIGMAQALGETAPLIMVGMVAFIVDVPQGFLDPATALPVQVYLWADIPERGFVERTAAAILALLFFLGVMNLAAIIARRKLEKRW